MTRPMPASELRGQRSLPGRLGFRQRKSGIDRGPARPVRAATNDVVRAQRQLHAQPQDPGPIGSDRAGGGRRRDRESSEPVLLYLGRGLAGDGGPWRMGAQAAGPRSALRGLGRIEGPGSADELWRRRGRPTCGVYWSAQRATSGSLRPSGPWSCRAWTRWPGRSRQGLSCASIYADAAGQSRDHGCFPRMIAMTGLAGRHALGGNSFGCDLGAGPLPPANRRGCPPRLLARINVADTGDRGR